MRFKEEIMFGLKCFIGALVATLTLFSLWPWYIKGLEKKDAINSLPSIKEAGLAIKKYEEDWGKLPPPNDWVNSASKYTKLIQDPTYVRITQEDQPENPGWGMNARINLSIGKGEKLPKSIKSSDFPPNAILLAPSYEEAVYPQRNGELPLQRLSKKNAEQTQHALRLGATKNHLGVSGLYFYNDGSVQQLSPQKVQELLMIRPAPPSKKAMIEKNIAYSDEVQWEPKEGVEVNQKNVVLKKGDILTPLIPFTKEELIISFEASSPKIIDFVIEVEYFNQYKFPINIQTKNGKLSNEAKIVGIYAGGRSLYTDKPISSGRGSLIAFNPSYGFADPIATAKRASKQEEDKWVTTIDKTEVHFAPGTVVATTTDAKQYFKQSSSTNWKEVRVKLKKSNAPEWTEFVGLNLKNNNNIPLTIKSIKVLKE
jgi:hypothetical protein